MELPSSIPLFTDVVSHSATEWLKQHAEEEEKKIGDPTACKYLRGFPLLSGSVSLSVKWRNWLEDCRHPSQLWHLRNLASDYLGRGTTPFILSEQYLIKFSMLVLHLGL